ncbi:MAG: pilus assembly protein TadG-related protein [Pseudomonadota bacterium]
MRLVASFLEIAERFRHASSGAVVVVAAVAMPLAVALGATAVEYSSLSAEKSRLQGAVDAAVLAATREMSLSNADDRAVEAVLRSVVQAHLGDDGNSPSLAPSIDRDGMRVSLDATKEVDLAFGQILGMQSVEIGASGAAQAIGQPNLCILGLHPSSAETIYLDSRSRVTGNNCAVFSNSTSSAGIESSGRALLAASTTCSAGGFQGGHSNFSPVPYVDCPTFDDPLLHRAAPTFSGCDYTDRVVRRGRHTLSPGVYCGGLRITDFAQVRFSPGVYVIKDGEFRIDSLTSVIGDHAGFYLAGPETRFFIGAAAWVSFEAPLDGDMAGLLFFSDRNQSGTVRNEITSNVVHKMVGTIYLPKAELHVRSYITVGDRSAYTAIVTNRLELTGRAHLVLNTNYDETDVPVPEGIRGAGQPARLVE